MKIAHLERQAETLSDLVTKLERENWGLQQAKEAYSDDNRAFAALELGKKGKGEVSDKEALMHYCTKGGARDFARNHPRPEVVLSKVGILKAA
jgi:hypothetical protein